MTFKYKFFLYFEGIKYGAKNEEKIFFLFLSVVSSFFFIILVGGKGETQQQTILEVAPQFKTDFGRLPLYFIPNKGQMDERVAYYVQGWDKAIYFTSEGLTISFHGKRRSEKKASDRNRDLASLKPGGKLFGLEGPAGHDYRLRDDSFFNQERKFYEPAPEELVERWVIKMEFVGANPGVWPEGLEETGTVVSYFKGKPEEWKTGLATCSKIIYRQLWPGVDLIFYGTSERMKYEFVVYPGADPSVIRLAYYGA